ncbi:MAG: hypothetical protein ABI777_11345, partial [Betaproteobacteria bacterium]
MTTGNEFEPRDDTLNRAWRAQSTDTPSSALDAAILAAAHRAVGSGPRDAKLPAEATSPQRWWMPLAAAATIGVVVIGILQVAPQAPVDTMIGERANVAERSTPAPATAAPENSSGAGVDTQPPKSDTRAAITPAPPSISVSPRPSNSAPPLPSISASPLPVAPMRSAAVPPAAPSEV